jgi:hypothetical protein
MKEPKNVIVNDWTEPFLGKSLQELAELEKRQNRLAGSLDRKAEVEVAI